MEFILKKGRLQLTYREVAVFLVVLIKKMHCHKYYLFDFIYLYRCQDVFPFEQQMLLKRHIPEGKTCLYNLYMCNSA